MIAFCHESKDLMPKKGHKKAGKMLNNYKTKVKQKRM
jgi:hypothetical protein